MAKWMNVSSSDFSQSVETKWHMIQDTVLGADAASVSMVASATFVEVKSGPSAGEKKVVINLISEPGQPQPAFWFRSDYNLQGIAEDGDKLDRASLRFYYLVASDEAAEYELSKQAEEFLANYDAKTAKAVKKLAQQHPVILVVTGNVK